jgi:hypothetical protein
MFIAAMFSLFIKLKTTFYYFTYLFILTQPHIYFMAPREGGACDFPNRDNNMCRYYFVGAESRNLI